jgi:hypothetical protein
MYWQLGAVSSARKRGGTKYRSGVLFTFFFATASLRFVLSCVVFLRSPVPGLLMGRAGLRIRFCVVHLFGGYPYPEQRGAGIIGDGDVL